MPQVRSVAGVGPGRRSPVRRVKFVADVNVSLLVVARLRSAGMDIVRVPDIMDGRTPDEEIVAEARRRGAVLISHDQDFSAILVVSGAASPSLINLRASDVHPERLARTIASVAQALEAALEAGAIITLDDRGARIHRLPIG